MRGSELLWRRWRDRHEVTIFGHEHGATRLDDRAAFRPLRGGETLDCGVRAHTIGRPRRAEIPFELPSHRALAFGDAVLEVEGELRVWATVGSGRRRTWYEQRFLPTLDALTGFDIERGARHARRAGAARRCPRAGGEPGTAAVEQVVADLITAAYLPATFRSTRRTLPTCG